MLYEFPDDDSNDDGHGRDVAQVCGHRLPKTGGNDDNDDDNVGDDDGDDGGDACHDENKDNLLSRMYSRTDHLRLCVEQTDSSSWFVLSLTVNTITSSLF